MAMITMRSSAGRFEMNGGARATASGAQVFARAMRHSAQVRFLRRAIPLGVLVAVAALLAVWLFDPFRQVIPNFTVQGVDLSSTQVVMEMPKLSGFKKDSRPYEVVAKSAIQDVSKPSIINLVEMNAHLVLGDGQAANLTAKKGIYDTQNETLDVNDNVRIKTMNGYDISLEKASMKFKSGDISSDSRVNVKMNDGEINADSVEMIDNDKRVTFIGNVHSRLDSAMG
ncbi:MAG: LPS export ABC transporter periplasmic protein LptC, partial [Hyphomicrobiales bacterium]|nr:LPS export ABC transporter periplasmic protein LptC [Hyphomicrobiales bacterium]